MKLFTLLVSIVLTAQALALEVPGSHGHVTDTAEMLSDKKAKEIESLLTSYEKETSKEIAILTIKSLEGEVLEEYSIKVAQTWGIGKEGKDNGVLLLISEKERKIRIEVGYGLEGDLTDMLAGRIIDKEIKPEFKEKDFDDGIEKGIKKIIEVLDGKFTAKDVARENKTQTGMMIASIALAIAAFLGLIHWIVSFVTGAVLGGILSYIYMGPDLVIAGIIIGAILCTIACFILRALIDSDSGGGWSSHGGSSSGSGSGSGFSSFGGGSFGGGGASGEW